MILLITAKWIFIVYAAFLGHELIPKGAYNGQKLTKLVKTKTPATTSKTIPRVPVIVFVK